MANTWRRIPDHPNSAILGLEYDANFNTHVTIHRKYLWVKKVHDNSQEALIILQHMIQGNAPLEDRAYAWVRCARILVDFFKDDDVPDFLYSTPFSRTLKKDVENCLKYWSSFYETVLSSSTIVHDLHNRLSSIEKMLPRQNHVVTYDELMQKERQLFENSTRDEKFDQVANNRAWLLSHDDAEARQLQQPINQPAARPANVYSPNLSILIPRRRFTPAELQFANSLLK